MSAVRPCSKCGIPKPPEAFYLSSSSNRYDGRMSACIECDARRYQDRKRSKTERLEALDWRTSAGITPLAAGKNTGQGRRLSPEERFWSRTTPGDDGCILWTGGRHSRHPRTPGKFYGDFSLNGTIAAHRYAYSVAYGRITESFQIHHVCRNTLCVNPEHLEALSPTEHGKLNPQAATTHCPRGHPYNEANTGCQLPTTEAVGL